MLDVSWIRFFPVPGNLSTHLIQFFKIELLSYVRNIAITMHDELTLIQQMMRDTFQYSQCHLPPHTPLSFYLSISMHILSWTKAWWRDENGTLYIYGFFIWNKFSLWSHIKLPRDVIISLMYQYRLQNFIDINRIMCQSFPYILCACKLFQYIHYVDNYYIISLCLLTSHSLSTLSSNQSMIKWIN